MNRDDEDPFASIAKRCHISSSQEVLFQNSPFARQFEAFSVDDSPENNEALVECTGIVMVSLPDDDDSPHDVFGTPPEEGSLLISSDQQRIATVDDNADRGIGNGTMAVDEGFTDGEKTVDLGKDSDLGFSEVRSMERNKGVCERGSPSEKVSGEFPSKRLKLCEETLGVESPKAYVGTVGDLKSQKVTSCNYTSKSSENCHMNEEILVVTKRIVCCNDSTEVVESECEENCEVLGFGGETGRGDSVVRDGLEGVGNDGSNGNIREGHELQSNGEGGSVRMSIEDVEKFQYVGPNHPNSRKTISGQFALPLSIVGRAENVRGEGELVAGVSSSGNQHVVGEGELVAGISSSANPNVVGEGESFAGLSSSKNPLWKMIRDVLKVLAERCEPDPSIENADLVDIAKSCGMTFPRLS